MFRHRWLITPFLLLPLASAAVCAEQPLFSNPSQQGKLRALLVGCSEYDHPRIPDLGGPANDVQLLRWILVHKFGFPDNDDAIVTLSEGQGAARRPTRANIVREFNKLASANYENGDQVVILLSGHGGRQLDNEPLDEADGYDEVFCPADVGLLESNGSVGRGGITDDEINGWLRGMSNRGANVWLIADSCHSGTLTRGGRDVARGIGPGMLTRGADNIVERDETAQGNIVAFFAASPAQKTFDTHFDGKPYGLFTYTLCKVLASADNHTMTYRRAILAVHNEYERLRRKSPTPQIEAELKDTVVLGQAQRFGSDIILSRGGDGYSVNAGSLRDLDTNSLLAVHPIDADVDATGGPRPLGYVRVTRANPVRAWVEPCTYNEIKWADPANLPVGAFCTVTQRGFNQLRRLAVAVDDRDAVGKALPHPLRREWQDYLSQLEQRDGRQPSLIRIVDDPREADWLVRVAPRESPGIVYLAPTTRFQQTAGDETFKTSPANEPVLAWLDRELGYIARSCSLLEIARDDIASGPSQLKLDVQLRRLDDDTDRTGRSIAVEPALELQEGELVGLVVQNLNPYPVYVSVLFVDSEYRTHAMFPRRAGQTGHLLEAGGNEGCGFMPVRCRINAKTIGQERFVVIAVRKRAGQGEAPDFTFLGQSHLDRTRGSAAAMSPLQQLLANAVYREGSRDAILSGDEPPLEEHALHVTAWHTVRVTGTGASNSRNR